ncbi:hypothetical protein [Granulicella sp. L60]|uniref:hypothetical protein n=1 Tax=Granulicella sp. L60 TaxID=1641866 RepID=UPI00131E18C3|nr:hypothetical protein [Granulicella sp. L60]
MTKASGMIVGKKIEPAFQGRSQSRDLLASLTLAATLVATGCAGSNNPNASTVPPGLPPAQAVSQSNSYIGTQSPGVWSLSLDHSQNAFAYQSLTYPSTPASVGGSFFASNGFMNLGPSSSGASEYATEMPGNVAVLRPGDDTTPPVVSVQQSGCFAIGGFVRFQFVGMPSPYVEYFSNGFGAGYGGIVASTDPTGKAWNFGALTQYVVPLTGTTTHTPGTTINGPAYVSEFAATCGSTNGVTTITASANAIVPEPTTFAISASGFVIADQSIGNVIKPSVLSPNSFVGMVQPSSPVATATVLAGNYLGFVYESSGAGSVSTQPASFNPTVGSSSSLTGGMFPNDDVTQLPLPNLTLTLGTQDSANNGLYTGATVTLPDPQQNCSKNNPSYGTPGADVNGNATCTVAAVIVAGNAGGKYAIFLAAYDATTQHDMGIYLFQQ